VPGKPLPSQQVSVAGQLVPGGSQQQQPLQKIQVEGSPGFVEHIDAHDAVVPPLLEVLPPLEAVPLLEVLPPLEAVPLLEVLPPLEAVPLLEVLPPLEAVPLLEVPPPLEAVPLLEVPPLLEAVPLLEVPPLFEAVPLLDVVPPPPADPPELPEASESFSIATGALLPLPQPTNPTVDDAPRTTITWKSLSMFTKRTLPLDTGSGHLPGWT
jgi:hypothetical protein